MKSYTSMDKSTWGDGPWREEADKYVWIDEVTNLDCMIHRGPLTGALCGYVGVPRDHPAFGKDYYDIDIHIHGGLTYAAPCQGDAREESGICHTPEPGRPDQLYWLGFDCGHHDDVTPGLDAKLREIAPELLINRPAPDPQWGPVYKPFTYVKAEVELLAQQLAAMKGEADEEDDGIGQFDLHLDLAPGFYSDGPD